MLRVQRRYASLSDCPWSRGEARKALDVAVLSKGMPKSAQLAGWLLLGEGEADAVPLCRLLYFWSSALSAGVASAWVGVSDKDVTDWYSFYRDISSKEMLTWPMQVIL